MAGGIINLAAKSMSTNLPEHDTMDDYIDYILGFVRPYSEDLPETDFFVEKRWLEISDRDDDTNIVLHIFGEGGNYMRVVNGNISTGGWSTLENSSNTMLINEGGRYELFDNVFLNGDFMILKKHRNQHTPIIGSKYFFIAKESMVKDGDNVMPWMDIMELWFNVYRQNSLYITIVVLIIISGIFILLLSTI
jgi:hypothetical protein